MSKLPTQPYKGTRDFYPDDFRLQSYIFDKWRTVCKSFGYEEYHASVIEPLELYAAKTSEEIVREQTFSFKDRGDREITLRPEMTPTVSRMVAARRQELGYPLRLFSIPNCFRYERMQRGRMREFWQLNFDLFGVDGIDAEIEMVLVMDAIMKSFGATSDMYEIRLNSRVLLNQKITESIVKTEEVDVIRLIDTFDKMKKDDFMKALSEKVEKPDDLYVFLTGNESNESVQAVLERCKQLGVETLAFNPTIARGFDYYTDIVFEVFDKHPDNNRAMFGGGRYDGLVGQFGVDPVPTIGIAPGDVTTQNFLESHNLLPELKPELDMYMIVEPGDEKEATKKAQQLRAEGKNVAVDYTAKKRDKQFKSAKKLGYDSEIIK